jgi:drug/metabolite transporter (DMT)-like permease
MLGEYVGIRRWSAVVVGFIGVLAIVRPGTGAFQPAALLVLGSSLAWAFATILTRRMADFDHAAATMLWAGITGLVLLSAMLPFDFVLPSPTQLALTLILGIVATTGQYMMVLAYRHAGAALLAPFSYMQLLYATFFGWFVFNSLPDEWSAVGATIIAASGIYTIHRERVRGRGRLAESTGQTEPWPTPPLDPAKGQRTL